MKQLLYHRIFEPKAFGHGGERRAAQLAEWLDSQGVERHYYPLRGIEGFRSICWSMRLVLQTYGWTILRHPQSLWRAFRFISYNYTKNLQDFNAINVCAANVIRKKALFIKKEGTV